MIYHKLKEEIIVETRYPAHPGEAKTYDTERLRRNFLIRDLFLPERLNLVYSHVDRMIVGGACPRMPISLPAGDTIKAEFFLSRRELGVINIGSGGSITVDGVKHGLGRLDGMYIGMGAREVVFMSDNPDGPARFYLNSAPAHQTYPTTRIAQSDITPTNLGTMEEANQRRLYKFIHPEGVRSCQLVMGMTALLPGSVWNSMPCHTHDRRMEVYLYFNLAPNTAVFHLMGEPEETRHIVVRNEEAVISPSWSIHCGAGTGNYTFIWGMAGENQTFSDMDSVPMTKLV